MERQQHGANSAVEGLLDEHLRTLGAGFHADPIAIYGPLEGGVDDTVRDVIEDLREQGSGLDDLVVLVDTEGGYLDVVRRIVETFRHHYTTVSFVIPNAAYSAGTILAMSGDAIYMDYYSRLGPIDPQVPGENGNMVPALGFLRRYEDLVARAQGIGDPLSLAEIQLLISGFNQAELYMYDQQRQLSVTLLEDWLATYKFKDWGTTRTRGLPVTDAMRRQRAVEVAKALNDTDRWHSHSAGISAAVLDTELNLRIDPFADHGESIRRYHGLLRDYMALNGHWGIVHAPGSYSAYHVHLPG